MENSLMIIINLFFIPVISIYILYYLNKEKSMTKYDILAHYFIDVVVITIITQIISKVLFYLFEKSLSLESAKYSIVAVIVAAIIPFLISKIKLQYLSVKSKKLTKEDKKDEKKESNA